LFAVPVLAIIIILFSFKNSDVITISDPYNKNLLIQSFDLQDTFSKAIDGVYMKAEEMPRFPGCEDVGDLEKRYPCAQKRMLQFIYKNIKYPAIARESNIQGSVVLQFNVSSTGSIEDISVVRGIGGGCDEECIRVVNLMNNPRLKWTPGKIDGKPVKVKFTLPIKFKLSPSKSSPSKVQEIDGQSDKVVVQAKAYVADGDLYKVVEDMPLFPDCDDMACSNEKLFKYVIANLKYPDEAREDKVEGTVVVTFVIEPNGSVSSIKVAKGLSVACDIEVIRVVESMNSMPGQWTPGIHMGEKVRVQFALPVSFKL